MTMPAESGRRDVDVLVDERGIVLRIRDEQRRPLDVELTAELARAVGAQLGGAVTIVVSAPPIAVVHRLANESGAWTRACVTRVHCECGEVFEGSTREAARALLAIHAGGAVAA